ncbi:MAG: phosphatase PAP2 family protein [Erysipelothrix sp.]|nr:phosphatase PAP2 family protein [Erysipelothrix sp.]
MKINMKELVEKVKKNKNNVRLIILFNHYITRFIYVLYPIVLIYLLITKDVRLKYLILIPGVMFVVVSFIRKKLNFKRPYEVYDYEPILSKETQGQSFPSRHVLSIFLISMGIFMINIYLGSVLLVLGVILALCRFLGGVHYLKDVSVGALLGVLPWLIARAFTLI